MPTYKRKDVLITVGREDGFGKNPGLWIGTENQNRNVKVASFGSKEKAELFCKWLDYLTGINLDRREVDWNEGPTT